MHLLKDVQKTSSKSCSPNFFSQIADKVPELLVTVKKEMINAERELTIRDAAKTFFIQFAELLQCLMQLHPGFPDLYEPIMKEIQVIILKGETIKHIT